jgi:hypothetical protein
MSDNWIIVIPELPDSVPTEDAQQRAIALFKRIAPEAEKIKAQTTDAIRFIDCGENLERVSCPGCGNKIDIHWWQDRMQEEVGLGFPLRLIDMPCCHAQISIDKLEYFWAQGFARFSVEALNPNVRDLSEKDMQDFERALGFKMRRILRHI